MQRSDIHTKIRLFNRAYTLAWERVSEAIKAKKPDIKEALAGGIRKQISLGLKDPAAANIRMGRMEYGHTFSRA